LNLPGNADHLNRLTGLLAKLDRIGPACNGKLRKLYMGKTVLEICVRQYMEPSNLLHSFLLVGQVLPNSTG
jgi:hypothetical protein